VREGSFSRAAFSLGIGQPAVSSRIQALEQTVGGALFTRGRRIDAGDVRRDVRLAFRKELGSRFNIRGIIHVSTNPAVMAIMATYSTIRMGRISPSPNMS